jgi:hypothetical protein
MAYIEDQKKLEELLKSLDSDLVECFKCGKKDKKHNMVDLYNLISKQSEYMCSVCFKRQHKRKRNEKQ